MALEHLAWPYRLGQTVMQETAAERKASAGCLAATPRGAILALPEMGVTTPLFGTQPVDANRMAGEINEFDPRLNATGETVLDLADPTVADVRVAVAAAGEEV